MNIICIICERYDTDIDAHTYEIQIVLFNHAV
jgi:uncharacterized protein YlaI